MQLLLLFRGLLGCWPCSLWLPCAPVMTELCNYDTVFGNSLETFRINSQKFTGWELRPAAWLPRPPPGEWGSLTVVVRVEHHHRQAEGTRRRQVVCNHLLEFQVSVYPPPSTLPTRLLPQLEVGEWVEDQYLTTVRGLHIRWADFRKECINDFDALNRQPSRPPGWVLGLVGMSLHHLLLLACPVQEITLINKSLD